MPLLSPFTTYTNGTFILEIYKLACTYTYFRNFHFLDINECATNTRLCDGGQCKNTVGSYQCICPIGSRFNSNNKMCEGMIFLVIECCSVLSMCAHIEEMIYLYHGKN